MSKLVRGSPTCQTALGVAPTGATPEFFREQGDLFILEGFDLAAMGYNSARCIHTLYQAMNLAFADRDFYYGADYGVAW